MWAALSAIEFESMGAFPAPLIRRTASKLVLYVLHVNGADSLEWRATNREQRSAVRATIGVLMGRDDGLAVDAC